MEGFWYYCAPLTIWGVCKNNATFKMSQASFHFSDYLSFCGIIWGPMSTSVTTNISSNKIRKSVKLPIMWFFLFYNFKRWCSSICWEIWFQGLWINDTVTSRNYIYLWCFWKWKVQKLRRDKVMGGSLWPNFPIPQMPWRKHNWFSLTNKVSWFACGIMSPFYTVGDFHLFLEIFSLSLNIHS